MLSKEEGGRHTPFFNGYRPQFYIRTTDVTGTLNLTEGVEMIMPGDNTSVSVRADRAGRARKGRALRDSRRRPHGRRRHGHGHYRVAASDRRRAVGKPGPDADGPTALRIAMRDIIQLACGECKRRNYSTTKNKKKTTERLEMKKYCRVLPEAQPHKEQK